MKQNILIPFLILLAVTLGCSRVTQFANSSTNAGTGSNSGSEPVKAADSAPAPAEFAPSGDPKADIEKLADRFVAIKSFKATMNGEGEMPMRTELEYVAPDRYRMTSNNALNVVIIGRTTYMKIGDKWQKMDLPLDNAIAEMRTAFNKESMKWVSDVKYTGDDTVNGKPAYVYTYHGRGPRNVGENDSKVWIAKADGLPVKVEAEYTSGGLKTMTIEYDYDTPITIEPPVK